jgi:hypothetical protein
MSAVTLNSHDLLGKYSIIKNHLSVLLSESKLAGRDLEYVQRCYDTTEELIQMVKDNTSPSV